MEISIEITGMRADPSICLAEVSDHLQSEMRIICSLISKGRNRIYQALDKCDLEILIKESKP